MSIRVIWEIDYDFSDFLDENNKVRPFNEMAFLAAEKASKDMCFGEAVVFTVKNKKTGDEKIIDLLDYDKEETLYEYKETK